MAWTFVTVGTATRRDCLAEERRIRAYHTAEAALRYHLLTGQPASLNLNNCQATASLSNGITATAVVLDDRRRSVTIKLDLERGFVTKRGCHEQ